MSAASTPTCRTDLAVSLDIRPVHWCDSRHHFRARYVRIPHIVCARLDGLKGPT